MAWLLANLCACNFMCYTGTICNITLFIKSQMLHLHQNKWKSKKYIYWPTISALMLNNICTAVIPPNCMKLHVNAKKAKLDLCTMELVQFQNRYKQIIFLEYSGYPFTLVYTILNQRGVCRMWHRAWNNENLLWKYNADINQLKKLTWIDNILC